MNFNGKCNRLFKVDIENIKFFVNSLTEDDWDFWNLRQISFRPHKKTKTYPFIWSYEENDKIIRTTKKNEIPSFINDIVIRLENTYKGKCVNLLLTKLTPKENILSHIDMKYLKYIHRFHLPIITNKNVIFILKKESFNLKEGFLYEINNTIEHGVENNSLKDRIHLMIDILPFSSDIKCKFIP